jgi:ectoine hydroxylase-related dioxygenase (phytanoyl-CoA dioxygenase family)
MSNVAISKIEFSKGDAKTLSSRTLRKVQLGMKRDGAVAFAKLFPMPLLKEARLEVMRRHRSGELREQGLVRDIAGRCTSVLPFEGPFLKPAFYANRKLLEVVAALLGTTHCIGSLEVVVALPGAYEQHQHIDGPLHFDRLVGKTKKLYQGDLSDLPPYAVGLAVPLCDVNEDNGPTAIWLGSHRTALRARPPGKSEVSRKYPVEYMVGDFGSAYLFDYRVFHGGTANHSREERPLLMFVFTRSWFRDPNQDDVFPSVAISRRNLKKIPERYRYLFMLAPAARRALWEKKGLTGRRAP